MANFTFHPSADYRWNSGYESGNRHVFSPPPRSAVQYVTVRDRRVVSLPCHWRQSQEAAILEVNNKSAYLTDGGLWRACKESRGVIARHSHYHGWLRIQNEAIRTREYFSTFSADWAGGEDDAHPALIETCEGEEECRMLVYPARDIFCLKVDNWRWRYLHHDEDHKFEMEMSFTSNLYNKGKTPSLWDPLSVSNIALEFDRSWFGNDIPDYIDGVRFESSVRGYFGYLLYKHAKGTLTFEDLWIVDKEIKWFDERTQVHDMIYRDYDTEYVEIQWSAAIHLESDEIRANLADFMYRVEDWLREYWVDYRVTTWDDPEPKDIFRLLVRRDNKVEDPRIGREPGAVTKAEGFGWVIFDVDESERDFDRYLGLFDDSDIDSHCSEFRRRYF